MALLTDEEAACLENELGTRYARMLEAPLAGEAGALVEADAFPLPRCFTVERGASMSLSLFSAAADGFSAGTQDCMLQLLKDDPAIAEALGQGQAFIDGPAILEVVACLTTEEAAALTPPGEGPPTDTAGLACLMEELEGAPSGERILAVLSGADASGEGLTMEESATLGRAVESCGIKTEFEFPASSGTGTKPADAAETLSWVADGVAGIFESEAVRLMRVLEHQSPEAIEKLLSVPRQWLPPRSGADLATLRGVVSISGTDEAAALDLLDMSFLKSVEWADLEAVRYLDRLGQADPGGVSRLMSRRVFADGIGNEEAILVPMVYLGIVDADAAARLEGLPWVADGISYQEPGEETPAFLDPTVLEPLKVLALVAAALSVRDTYWELTGKTWMQRHHDTVEMTLMEEIIALAQEDEELTLRLLAMPFLDRYDSPDSYAWEFLAGLARESGDQLDYILTHPTFAQGITDENKRELTEIYREAFDVPRYVADAPVWPLAVPERKPPAWVLDPRTPHHAAASETLGALWLSHPAMAGFLIRLPWVADGIDSGEEASTVSQIRDAVEADAALARDLEAFWSVNGFSDLLFRHVQYLASIEPLAARRILDLPWVGDGVSQAESTAIRGLSRGGKVDLELLDRVLAFPWALDEVTPVEAEAVDNLVLIWWRDRGLGETVIRSPWVVDGINRNEGLALLSLGRLAYSEQPPLASSVMDKMGGLMALDRDAVGYALAAAAQLGESPDDLRAVADSSWFSDGVDLEDAAFMTVLVPLAYQAPEFYRELLESRFTVGRSIILPLAGEVHLWAFQNVPLSEGEELLDVAEQAVRHMESLMGAPFPTSDLIILAGGPGSHSGVHNDNHITLNDVIAENARANAGVIRHEIAHYYFDINFGHVWLREGAAEYAASYIGDAEGDSPPWEQRRADVSRNVRSFVCEGLESIIQLHEKYDPVRDTPQCAYFMGENFLNETRLLIGEDALHNTLRDIYMRTPAYDNPWPSEEEIYGMFLRNVPEGERDAFNFLYDRLHGGRQEDSAR